MKKQDSKVKYKRSNVRQVQKACLKKESDENTQPKTSLLSFFKAAPYQETELDIQHSKELPRKFEL